MILQAQAGKSRPSRVRMQVSAGVHANEALSASSVLAPAGGDETNLAAGCLAAGCLTDALARASGDAL